MAKIKKKELRALSKEERSARIIELKKELMKSYTEVSRGTAIKNPGQIKETKRNIARMLTMSNAKQSNQKTKEAKKKA